MGMEMYTAIVIDENSKAKILSSLKDVIPNNWKVICHHMTIDLKPHNESILSDTKYKLNQMATMTAIELGIDDKAIALKVVSDVPSINKIKHITVAINVNAKPVDSNYIKNWREISPIEIVGTIMDQ